MLSILVGLIAAMVFGIASYLFFGLDALTEYRWIEVVFWSIVGTGVAVAGLDLIRCKICEISNLFKKKVRLCDSVTCSSPRIV